MITVKEVIDCRGRNGLGYSHWLLVEGYGAGDCLLVNPASDNPSVARCHPAISATPEIAKAIGVNVGEQVAGVRWMEPYNGQEVCNSHQIVE